MTNLKISIITVTLNAEKYIERCLNSVENQNYKNIEHIIIDGQSSDNTIKIINKNIKNYHKVCFEKDLGIWDAMNKGLKIASGDIVCFLNSDDYYYPNALNIVAKYFNNFDIDFLFGTVQKYKLMHGFKPWKIKYSFGFYTSHSIGFFIKTNKHLEVGLYDNNFLSADLNFFYKMIVNKKLKGMSTSKNEVLGKFQSGGFSSKINYLDHLKDLNKIRLNNNQNFFWVYLIYIYKLIINFKKVLKSLLY